MNFLLMLVFDYDARDWAAEYGVAESDAASDFSAVVRRAVDDGSLRDAVDPVWPIMRGHVTVRIPDQLDPALRDELLNQLRRARDTDLDEALLAEIRNHLIAHQDELDRREPRWVIFHSSEWDNGYFLTGNGGADVYFTDGDTVEIDFDGTAVDELLTDAYSARGANAGLGVDLT